MLILLIPSYGLRYEILDKSVLLLNFLYEIQ
jgi:hypothetical protein